MNIPLATVTAIQHSPLDIDHILVCVCSEPNEYQLTKLGLHCHPQTVRHPEQGIASRLIFFENFYLELIWVEHPQKAHCENPQANINFLARSQWKTYPISPFGIVACQSPNVMGNEANGHVETPQENQVPVYFNPTNLATQSEPFCFVIPPEASLIALMDHTKPTHNQFIDHPLGLHRLTRTMVNIVHQRTTLTSPLTLLESSGLIEIGYSSVPCLNLEFDHCQQNKTLNLHLMGIPITIRY